MIYNSKYEVLTSEGFQDFAGIKRTSHNSSVTILFNDSSDIRVTEKHKFFINGVFKYVEELSIGDIISHKKIIDIIYNKHDDELFYDLIEVENGHHYTTSGVESSNCAFIRPSIFNEFIDAFLPSQAALSWKKNIVLSTPKGQNHFFDIVKGASPDYASEGSGVKKKGTSGYVLFKVDWRDVPRYDKDGNLYEPEVFKKNIVDKHGILYWNQNFACISGDSLVRVYDKYSNNYETHNIITLKELLSKYITTDYTSRKYNDRYLIETINGYEPFDNIISRGLKKTLFIRTENKTIIVSHNHKFVVKNITFYADELKVGNYLETKNGLEYITEISENGEIEVFDILNTKSHTYIANDINNHNCEFLGSSHTLLDSKSLESFESIEPLELRDGKLKIYKYPEKGHQYICAVDSAKDGIDDFSVQIVDITGFKFEQVASAQLQIDYLLMPEYINDWCEYYNKPYLIIENNEGSGQSIADQMKITYEYENLHYDTKLESNSSNNAKSRKKYPGFRTTPKSRKLILQTLKLFIDNKNLKIYDKKTINQFYTFILINNKYQADENCKDDAVMSLAMIFAPFCSSKNFDDMKGLVDRLYSDFDSENESEEESRSFIEYLTVGSFDDGTNIEDNNYQMVNGYIMEPDGFY